jgi:acetoin utilization deacetylase AcuC-like enzyme
VPAALTVVWSPRYEVDIGHHVFPTAKYRLVRDRLVEERVVGVADIVEPEAVNEATLGRVHTAEYLRKIRENDFTPDERTRLEVPITQELIRAARVACGGTLLAARRAMDEGVAVHLGGGFHHAFADHGEGFCLLNDVAVASCALLAERKAEQVLIIDLDVHHGNGTAAIFADESRVFTFSMHQQNNYPAEKPRSDYDVGLPDGVRDDRYMVLLDEHIPRILDARRPEIVFYLAGADPYREDQLGGLGLSLDGLRQRDRLVLHECRHRNIPVAVTMAGGYALRTEDTVAIHVATVQEAVDTRRSTDV